MESLVHCIWWSLYCRRGVENHPGYAGLSPTPIAPLAALVYLVIPGDTFPTGETTQQLGRLCNCRPHVCGVCYTDNCSQSGINSTYLTSVVKDLIIFLVLPTYFRNWVCISYRYLEDGQLNLLCRSMRVRAGLVTAIYTKALVLSNDERTRASGDIVNLMSVDATRLQDLCTYGLIAISGPLQVKR